MDTNTATAAPGTAKRGYLRELGIPTVFGAVVLLVSATLLLGANIAALRGSLKQMEHSQQAVNQISQLEIERLGLELAVRGYGLTGHEQFLRIQHEGDVRRENALIEMERLTQSSPTRRAEYKKLMRDIKKHAAIFDRLTKPGPDPAGAIAKAALDPDLRVMKYAIRDDLANLRAAELGDIHARQQDITDQLGRAFILAVGIIVAAFVLGGMGVWATQLKAPQKS